MRFTTCLTSILSLFTVTMVNANPVTIESRDVFVPPILYPHAGTVWFIGQRHNVTWDTSQAPVNITNKVGIIQLRQGGISTPCILAQGFDILLGRIEITVPTVFPSTDFQLVLFGDSGNFSPVFTISS